MMKKIIIYGLFSLLLACSAGDGNNRGEPSDVDEALDMISSVFSGFYKKEEIKAKMDSTMQLYNMPLTKDNYLNLGNQLTSLRKESTKGIREMDILNEILMDEEISDSLTLSQSLNHFAKLMETRNHI